MIDPSILRDTIRLSLTPLDLWSQEAEELLLMTAAHESKCGEYLVQLGDGPALGVYQMEPETLWDNYLHYLNYSTNRELAAKIASITGVDCPELHHLQFNPIYSTIHARLKYRRDKKALPPAGDTWAMAEYAKRVYNSNIGAATVADYHDAYRALILS